MIIVSNKRYFLNIDHNKNLKWFMMGKFDYAESTEYVLILFQVYFSVTKNINNHFFDYKATLFILGYFLVIRKNNCTNT